MNDSVWVLGCSDPRVQACLACEMPTGKTKFSDDPNCSPCNDRHDRHNGHVWRASVQVPGCMIVPFNEKRMLTLLLVKDLCDHDQSLLPWTPVEPTRQVTW